MVNIAICDDEKVYSDAILDILSECAKFISFKTKFDVYNSSEELLEVLEENPLKYSILFVDILMPGLTGVELSQRIKRLNENIYIIFITSTKDFIFDAYDIGALNYILKPIEKNRLEEQFLRAIKAVKKKNESFVVNKNNEIYTINIEDIIYFEVRNRVTTVEYVGGTLDFYEKISDVEERLKEYNFIKTHRSYIVNPEYIFKISSSTIELKDGRWIPISKLRLKSIKKEFMHYIETNN
ncbi:MAG: LytR/AlgR family response regulator transcription factor [Sarcina sp.]